LIEYRRDAHIDLSATLRADVAERPQAYFRRLELNHLHARLGAETGATAIFNGERGDEMFFKSLPSLAAADYLHDHWIGKGLMAAISSAARLEERSVWNILGRAVHRALISKEWGSIHYLTRYSSLICEHIRSSLQMSDIYRWPESRGRIPPGKQLHLLGITNPSEYYYLPFEEAGEPKPVSPLISQPLIEVALRIPTYILTSDGWDRALARQAFAPDVPRSILLRRSKGGMEEFLNEIFERNLTFLRTLMMDGLLVKHGVLDRAKVDAALSGRPSTAMKGFVKIFQYLGIETWLQIWQARHPKATV
jgi:asparagine synthase (glutamine-hydrolysing)